MTTVRFCANHGDYVLLAHCPIVATNERTNGRARERLASVPAEPGIGDSADFDRSILGLEADEDGESEAGAFTAAPTRTQRRLPATLAPAVDSLLLSHVDGLSRLVLAEPYSRTHREIHRSRRVVRSRAHLPSAYDLARDDSARPARACPRCCHPLPVDVDECDVYPVAIAGNNGASKTTTLVALIDAVETHGCQVLGVPEFEPSEVTMQYLGSLEPNPLAEFKSGRAIGGTDPRRRHPPLEFRASLPSTSRRLGRPASVLLQDASGEVLMSPDSRPHDAPIILWPDAILFIYNPDDSPVRRPTDSVRPQSVLLSAILRDVRARRADKRRRDDLPPLIVAVSKSDKLDPRPDVRAGPAPEQAVISAVARLKDRAMIEVAAAWPETYWRFIAPQPEDKSGQQGVTDLFQLLLTVLNR